MARPRKSTEGMTPEEIEKLERLRQQWRESKKRYKENHPDWRKAHAESQQRGRQKRLLESKELAAKQIREAQARWSGTPNPEPFDFQRISREDYLRCQVWLLRWMCECFDGCLLPENVRKRLELMIGSCDEHLRIEDNQGYMRIIMT